MSEKEGTTWGHVRLIFDECAVAVVFVRKQMGKMRKTELVLIPLIWISGADWFDWVWRTHVFKGVLVILSCVLT